MRTTFALAAVLATASVCSAGTWNAYGDAAFNAAQQKGKLVLLQFTALGCDLCADQQRVIQQILVRPEFKDVAGFHVDFDAFKQVDLRWNVEGRSTLILLKGGKEINRSAGIVTEAEIATFLRRAVPQKLRGRPKARPSNRVPPRP